MNLTDLRRQFRITDFDFSSGKFMTEFLSRCMNAFRKFYQFTHSWNSNRDVITCNWFQFHPICSFRIMKSAVMKIFSFLWEHLSIHEGKCRYILRRK